MIRRYTLFFITNLAVMLIFGIVLFFTGIKSSSFFGLIILSGLFGFGGSFISLLMSKYLALNLVGGKIIHKPNSEVEYWLLDTVRKQSEAVNITIPQVAIYDTSEINAFATGASRNSALIAVSTGLLNNMERNEAEAVIAHEITHICNGDMVTMALLQGIMNTFVIFISRIIAQTVSGFLSTERNDEESKNGNPLIYFMVSTLLEVLFGFLANIIVLWFSRSREFHADAGAAKIVGVEKMIAALKKLKLNYSLIKEDSDSIQTFYVNGRSSNNFAELFMSHPPLDKRIKALKSGTFLIDSKLIL